MKQSNMKVKYQACFMLVANDFTEKLVSWCPHIHSLVCFSFCLKKRASELATNYKKQKTGIFADIAAACVGGAGEWGGMTVLLRTSCYTYT